MHLLEIPQVLTYPMVITILIVFAIFVAVRLISGMVKLAFKVAIIVGAIYVAYLVFKAVTGS